jgi:hypothetical protein
MDKAMMMLAIILGQLVGDHIDSQGNIERQLQILMNVIKEAFEERTDDDE